MRIVLHPCDIEILRNERVNPLLSSSTSPADVDAILRVRIVNVFIKCRCVFVDVDMFVDADSKNRVPTGGLLFLYYSFLLLTLGGKAG